MWGRQSYNIISGKKIDKWFGGIGKGKKGAFVGLDPGGTYDNLVYLSLHLWETLIKEETDSGTLNT